ncbi:MAG TPA: beta-N-acetylhexosaminidase [Puia sp.]|nr:beta-N-acetylhexosaminidase [Puia sp.]
MKNVLFALLLFIGAGAHGQPDFAVKAFHLDLRIQVMTMPALRTFVQQLHAGGINTLIMEYEATYPFKGHPLIPNRYAYTRAEIVSFIAYCKNLDIDVIPLQQSFGHVEYILRHDRYRRLREDDKALSQVCPLRTTEDSLLFTELYTDLAQTHPSPYIHIGCDETYLLGHCERCRRKVQEEGISKLYIDYVSMLCNIVLRLGKKPVLWADMVVKYPEAISRLPAGTVLVDWNYGWSLDHFGDHKKLLASGYTIWGAPAIRSSPDNFYLTKWEKHFDNIRDFVPAARNMGYRGMVLTSWSTSGAYSYVYEAEDELADLAAIRHVYPITGFNILIAAYFESLRSAAPLDVQDFIIDYCHKQYGFTRDRALTFWQALKDTSATAVVTLHSLQPQRNKEEFEHYRLMADIRAQHLRFEKIAADANAPGFTQGDVPILLTRLRALLAEAPALDQRFIALNRNAYYPAELDHENELRTARIRDLYARLNKSRTNHTN